jgi:DNA-binding Lrp family transcriptional regulator
VNQARLDQKDQEILLALRKNARKTIAHLSQELGIPRATVHERIKKLRRSGVIKKFTIEQDYARIGLPALSFILASYNRSGKNEQEKVAKKLAELSNVRGVYIISGEWDFLVKVRGQSIADIGTRTADSISRLPEISRTHTVACFETVMDEI